MRDTSSTATATNRTRIRDRLTVLDCRAWPLGGAGERRSREGDSPEVGGAGFRWGWRAFASARAYARRSTLDARRSTLDARRSTLDARRSTLDARRSTLDARRSTLDARRSTIKMETTIQECQALIDGGAAGPGDHAPDGLCLFHGLLLCDRSALGCGRGGGCGCLELPRAPDSIRGRLGASSDLPQGASTPASQPAGGAAAKPSAAEGQS